MKTDIQIAQEAELLHIRDVAAKIGIEEEDLEFYGNTKQNFPMTCGIRSKTVRTENWFL